MLAIGYAVVLAVLVLAALVLFFRLQKGQGRMAVKGAPVQILPKNANYALLYATCAVVAAVLAAALALGSLTLLYGVLVAWLLILAVYYTVRLM